MRPQTNSRRACAAVYIVLITALSVALFAARADAATPFGISDDGAMLAVGGIDWAAGHGVKDVRFQVRKGQLDRYDKVVADADRLNMRVIISPLARPDEFAEHAARIAARWPQIDAISDYNEPEINGFKTDPCGYIRLHNDTREKVRQVRKSLPVLFGEFSPHGTFPYLKALAACDENPRGLRNISFHPYQWSTDPLSPRQLDSQDHGAGWWGIGKLPRMMRWMGRKSTLRAFGIRKAPRLWISEFGYLTDYASQDEINRWWPRAISLANRLNAQTIIAQGAVTDGEHRKWRSPLPHGLVSKLASL
jgi:hypothetical protein